MKRFYCTVCKKVKRVRVLPSKLEQQYADIPSHRIGHCDNHSISLSSRNDARKFASVMREK